MCDCDKGKKGGMKPKGKPKGKGAAPKKEKARPKGK